MANTLFNIPIRAAGSFAKPAAVPPAGASRPGIGKDAVGVINSQQGVITFAGAPTAVFVVWSVLRAVSDAAWLNGRVFPVALSVIVGMLIYWSSAPANPDGGMKAKVLGFIFALINSFTIAATAIGVQTTIPPAKGQPAAPTPAAVTTPGAPVQKPAP